MYSYYILCSLSTCYMLHVACYMLHVCHMTYHFFSSTHFARESTYVHGFGTTVDCCEAKAQNCPEYGRTICLLPRWQSVPYAGFPPPIHQLKPLHFGFASHLAAHCATVETPCATSQYPRCPTPWLDSPAGSVAPPSFIQRMLGAAAYPLCVPAAYVLAHAEDHAGSTP